MYRPGWKSCEVHIAAGFITIASLLLWRVGPGVAGAVTGMGYVVSTLIAGRTLYKRKTHDGPAPVDSKQLAAEVLAHIAAAKAKGKLP